MWSKSPPHAVGSDRRWKLSLGIVLVFISNDYRCFETPPMRFCWFFAKMVKKISNRCPGESKDTLTKIDRFKVETWFWMIFCIFEDCSGCIRCCIASEPTQSHRYYVSKHLKLVFDPTGSLWDQLLHSARPGSRWVAQMQNLANIHRPSREST